MYIHKHFVHFSSPYSSSPPRQNRWSISLLEHPLFNRKWYIHFRSRCCVSAVIVMVYVCLCWESSICGVYVVGIIAPFMSYSVPLMLCRSQPSITVVAVFMFGSAIVLLFMTVHMEVCFDGDLMRCAVWCYLALTVLCPSREASQVSLCRWPAEPSIETPIWFRWLYWAARLEVELPSQLCDFSQQHPINVHQVFCSASLMDFFEMHEPGGYVHLSSCSPRWWYSHRHTHDCSWVVWWVCTRARVKRSLCTTPRKGCRTVFKISTVHQTSVA